MAYKLSDRNELGRHGSLKQDPDRVDLGALATVFILFGLICLATAWFYNGETTKVVQANFQPYRGDTQKDFGPIHVHKEDEVYNISFRAKLSYQSWSFVEGQVLDKDKQYLFSFGKELSLYGGSDWTEEVNDYDIKITFPEPGQYYLRVKTDSSQSPRDIRVEMTNMMGSSLPHLWLGIITLLIGVVLNEIRNLTIIRLLGRFS